MKLTEAVRNIVDARVEGGDKTTAKELSEVLTQSGSRMSFSTILGGTKARGWTSHETAYCFLVDPFPRKG